MAFWLAFPLVAYGAKKLWDAFSDDEEERDEAGFQAKATAAKAKRTKARKKAIKDLIQKQRIELAESLRNEMPLGISVLTEPNSNIRVDYSDLNNTILTLGSVMADLKEAVVPGCGRSGDKVIQFTVDEDDKFSVIGIGPDLEEQASPHYRLTDSWVIRLADIAETTEKAIRNAEDSFGESSGIDSNDEYKKSRDPFFKILKERLQQ